FRLLKHAMALLLSRPLPTPCGAVHFHRHIYYGRDDCIRRGTKDCVLRGLCSLFDRCYCDVAHPLQKIML
uniref:Uncharacterized protein n=1 Tax=Sparus aurata TaxID=8175 RepID=A0A671TN64_SPAAU